MARRPVVLYLGSNPARPSKQTGYLRCFELLSSAVSGYVIAALSPAEPSLAIPKAGDFEFFAFYYRAGSPAIRIPYTFAKHVLTALSLFYRRRRRFEVVIASNPLIDGLAALTIGALTGARVVVEVNGNFEVALGCDAPGKEATLTRLKASLGRRIVPWVLRRVDLVKLLYPTQLAPLGFSPTDVRTTSYAAFVPVDAFLAAEKREGDYLLLMGYPWYLKGVDLLIRAFNRVTRDFPDARLKVVGWCPEGMGSYERLAEGNPNVVLSGPVYFDETVKLMAGCRFYVLASRTEAMGRVLVEAMASGKAVVASRVGGVPEIVADGVNGLLFESENIDDLAEKLRTLLADPATAARMGANGAELARTRLSEQAYLSNYLRMLETVLGEKQVVGRRS
jgi:glycosyltransferase involved in cell wall biosynthesis